MQFFHSTIVLIFVTLFIVILHPGVFRVFIVILHPGVFRGQYRPLVLDDLLSGERLFSSFDLCLTCVVDNFLELIGTFFEHPEKAATIATEAEDPDMRKRRDLVMNGVVSITTHRALRSAAWLKVEICSDNNDMIKYMGDVMFSFPLLFKLDLDPAAEEAKLSEYDAARILRTLGCQSFNFELGAFDEKMMSQLQKLHLDLATPSRIAKIHNILCADATTKLTDIKEMLTEVGLTAGVKTFGSLYERDGDTLSDVDGLSQVLSKIAPAAEATGPLMTLAMKLDDKQVQSQLRVVDILSKCLPACGNAAAFWKNVFSSIETPASVHTQALQIFGQLQTELLLVEKNINIRTGQHRWDTCFEPAAAEDLKHLRILDGAIAPQHVLVHMKDEMAAFVKTVSSHVEDTLRQKSAIVRSLCPDWLSRKETLATDVELINTFISNTKFAELGKATDLLAVWANFARAFRKCFPIDRSLIASCKIVEGLGHDTVCMTFLLQKLKNISLVQNLVVRAERLDAVHASLETKQFAVPECLSTVIDDLKTNLELTFPPPNSPIEKDIDGEPLEAAPAVAPVAAMADAPAPLLAPVAAPPAADAPAPELSDELELAMSDPMFVNVKVWPLGGTKKQ